MGFNSGFKGLNGAQGQGVVSRLYQRDHPTVTAIFSVTVLRMLHTYWV